jgi:hypothetical protein
MESEPATSTFHRHLIEMTLSMVVPWSAFFLIVHFGLPRAGVSPPSFLLVPVALLVMVGPMSALMLFRSHGLRHILEMNASMFAGMIVAMPVVRIVLPAMGVQLGLDLIFPIALLAMTVPMVLLMYVRREHYAQHVHAGVASSG